MKLIVGLGNPGYDYVFTRHNIGWLIVDHILSQKNAGAPSKKFGGEFWILGNTRGIALLKPHTWMNLSGLSAREAFDFYKINAEDILIVCDDVALPFGKLRIRTKGSAGGHNGLASVIGALGTLEIPRLRVGVGNKPVGGNMRNWVLGHFPEENKDDLPALIDKAAEAALLWAEEGIEKAMNVVNAKQGLGIRD
ncbi:MAG: aminoacyl-tRNA hydrolase [Synergistaceae bacterium]|nr:aminoacyl-tRNA hydrolase [Synergistaceae bacterium]